MISNAGNAYIPYWGHTVPDCFEISINNMKNMPILNKIWGSKIQDRDWLIIYSSMCLGSEATMLSCAADSLLSLRNHTVDRRKENRVLSDHFITVNATFSLDTL